MPADSRLDVYEQLQDLHLAAEPKLTRALLDAALLYVAAGRGDTAGLDVVSNRCVKIEHARFHGGLHLAGFDTGVISSKRQLISR